MVDTNGNILAGTERTCRNGHVKTTANTYRSKSGHERCRDCRRRFKPLKTRPCAGCKQPFAGRGKKCPVCVAIRHMTTLEEAKTPIRTRTCVECLEPQPLERFRLPVADFRAAGVARYSDHCEDCRAEDEGDEPTSPYERAKQQIARIFGRPAREWINRPGHVLNDLHFLRMLAIQHGEAKRTGQRPVRPEVDTRSKLLWPRLRELLHPPTPTLRAA